MPDYDPEDDEEWAAQWRDRDHLATQVDVPDAFETEYDPVGHSASLYLSKDKSDVEREWVRCRRCGAFTPDSPCEACEV